MTRTPTRHHHTPTPARLVGFRWRARLLILGCTLALILTSCARPGQPEADDAAATGYVAGEGVGTYIKPADREPMPAISGELIGGGFLDLADWRGQLIVINVWGSWCPPCREETPYLVELATELDNQGVRFVGINVRDNEAAAQAFTRTHDVPYPSFFDPASTLLLAFADTLPPSAIPSTILIDPDGNVAARIVGATTYTQLQNLIARVQRNP